MEQAAAEHGAGLGGVWFGHAGGQAERQAGAIEEPFDQVCWSHERVGDAFVATSSAAPGSRSSLAAWVNTTGDKTSRATSADVARSGR